MLSLFSSVEMELSVDGNDIISEQELEQSEEPEEGSHSKKKKTRQKKTRYASRFFILLSRSADFLGNPTGSLEAQTTVLKKSLICVGSCKPASLWWKS